MTNDEVEVEDSELTPQKIVHLHNVERYVEVVAAYRSELQVLVNQGLMFLDVANRLLAKFQEQIFDQIVKIIVE